VVCLARITGDRKARFYRDDPAIGRIRWYRVPSDRPPLPIPHCFEDPLQVGEFRGEDLAPGVAGVLGEQAASHRGLGPGWFPPGHFCGSPEAWLGGARRGIDPPLVWGWDWRSSCCRGRAWVGTGERITKWDRDGVGLVDSRLNDPGEGYVTSDAEIAVPALAVALLTQSPSVDAGRVQMFATAQGLLYAVYPTGMLHPMGWEAVTVHVGEPDPHPQYTTPERAVDAVADALADSETVRWYYDPTSHVILADVVCYASIVPTPDGLALDGDLVEPGPGAYYGTDPAGDKAWLAFPESKVQGDWRFDASLAMADPGSGRLRFNAATVAATTRLGISATTSDGRDASPLLLAQVAGDSVAVFDTGNTDNLARFRLTAALVDHLTWFELPVAALSASGSAPNNNSPLTVVLAGSAPATPGLAWPGIASDVVPKGGTPATGLTGSRIKDTGAGAIQLLGSALVYNQLSIYPTADFSRSGYVKLVISGTDGYLEMATPSGPGAAYGGPILRLSSDALGGTLYLYSGSGASTPAFGIGGFPAAYLSSGGWDVRGGLVYGVPPAPGAPYDDEKAQDAVGAALLDTPSIDLTYDDAAGEDQRRGARPAIREIRRGGRRPGRRRCLTRRHPLLRDGQRRHPGFFPLPASPTATALTATLSAAVAIGATTPVGIGLYVPLPTAGTYLLAWNLTARVNVASGLGYILTKLRNLTAGADIPGSDRVVGWTMGIVGSPVVNSVSGSQIVTVAAAATVEVWASLAGGPSYTECYLLSGAPYQSTISYVRLA
jgi:hypothetical protein